jgi:hypothetical protein
MYLPHKEKNDQEKERAGSNFGHDSWRSRWWEAIATSAAVSGVSCNALVKDRRIIP